MLFNQEVIFFSKILEKISKLLAEFLAPGKLIR